MTLPSQVAADTRVMLGLSPDQAVPDLEQLLKDNGYHVQEMDLEDSCSGFSEWVGGANYLIAYNSQHQYGPAFKRFTLAHELGHISMHFKMLHDEQQLISAQHLGSKDPQEKEANEFAAHFLMPKRAFSLMADRLPFTADSIRKLAEHFGVSELATAMHYVKLTDLACTMIVCDVEGNTKYECRSSRMGELLRRVAFVHKSKVPNVSLTADWMSGRRSERLARVRLNEWMPQASINLEVEESVIQTPDYLYLTLLTPTETES
jgi:Zn-dependent peptidase ImmA (M78 family)